MQNQQGRNQYYPEGGYPGEYQPNGQMQQQYADPGDQNYQDGQQMNNYQNYPPELQEQQLQHQYQQQQAYGTEQNQQPAYQQDPNMQYNQNQPQQILDKQAYHQQLEQLSHEQQQQPQPGPQQVQEYDQQHQQSHQQNPSMDQYQPQELQGANMQNSQHTQFSDNIRRNYPKDVRERKQEWWGLDYHKQEVNQELMKNEIEIKNLKQKHLLTELENKILQHLLLRQEELQLKLLEATEMQKKQQIYLEQLRKGKQDQVYIQNQIANFYDQQKQMALERDREYKRQKLEWEEQLLAYNQQRIQMEQEKKKEQKEYLKNELLSDLQREQNLRYLQQQQKLTDKNEYNQLIKYYNEKQQNKEDNYKFFFQQCAKNQEQLQLQHYENILKPLLKRQAELEEIINKNCGEYQRRRAQDELNRIYKQKSELERTRDQIMNQIQEKSHKRELEKIEKEQKVKERLEDLANLQQWQEYKRGEKLQEQIKYKEFLDQQYKEKREVQQNIQRMNRQDKALNKLDLQAFKNVDTGLYSMQVGWSPQIGQLPPRQNRDKFSLEIMESLKHPDNRQTNKYKFEPQYVSNIQTLQSPQQKDAKSTFQNAAQNNLTRNSMPLFKPYQKIGEPDDRFKSSFVVGQQPIVSQQPQPQQYTDMYRHNPITNQIPFRISNKYIAQDIFRNHDPKQNLLQQVGVSSVGGHN